MTQSVIEEFVSIIVEDYFTKLNEPITFKVHETSPDINDRSANAGWIIHKIEAFVNGEEAGYIKISYIPHERFLKRYPSILEWLILRGQTTLEKYNLKDPEERFKAILEALGYNYWNWPAPEQLSNPVFRSSVKKRFNKKYQKDFHDFKTFHVDKPLVDYIRVNPEFQRRRVAEALYDYAARWLAQKGLKLYASGLQSDAAKAAWDHLRVTKKANIGSEESSDGRKRTFLSYL